jgi:signal transduction histidine kinase/CheY-like chemotaxis protein
MTPPHNRRSTDRGGLQPTPQALAAAGIGIWEMNLETRRLTWTESLSALLNRPDNELSGSLSDSLRSVHPDDAAALAQVVEGAAGRGSGFTAEFRVPLADGGVRWLRSVGHLLDDAAGRRLLGVTTDISTQHSLETQLRQSQKMEAIGRLAGGVAHDFNNLLTAILGYAHFLVDELAESDQRRDVEEIIKAANRAAELTRQLLAFSRQQVAQTRQLDVNATIRDIAHMLRRLIGPHVELVTAQEGEAYVRADRGQLEQVIMNLAVTARAAMPGGGQLRIDTATVTVDAGSPVGSPPLEPGTYVRLGVSDTGQGMTAETRARLFEPSGTGRDHSKSGLGLATVYAIVTLSGGHIDVASEPGRGTTFTVHLPVDSREVPAPPVPVEPARPAAGSILLVEDEDAVRYLARIILERAGYTVFEAANAPDAERVFTENEERVDAIVTDVLMPGGKGTDMVARLVGRKPSLKVVYMSGYTDDAAFARDAMGQAARFVQKPFHAPELTRALAEVLDA